MPHTHDFLEHFKPVLQLTFDPIVCRLSDIVKGIVEVMVQLVPEIDEGEFRNGASIVEFTHLAPFEEEVKDLGARQHDRLVRQISVVRDVLDAVRVVIRVQAKFADELLEFLSDPLEKLELLIISLPLFISIHGPCFLKGMDLNAALLEVATFHLETGDFF